MPQEESGNVLTVVVVVVIVFTLLGLGAFYLISNKAAKNNLSIPNLQINQSEDSAFFEMVKSWVPDATWGIAKQTTTQTLHGEVKGEKIEGEITSDNPSISRFDSEEQMKKLGFIPDINLSADGPGASNWGYKRQLDGQTQVAIFSYSTEIIKGPPDQPLEFKCPCKIYVSAFLSNPPKL